MNSYDTLRLLTQELRSTLLNARFIESTTPLRQTWVGLFISTDSSGKEEPIQLQFHSSADRISLFFRSIKNEEIAQRKKRKNRRLFFEDLNGKKVVDIALADDDRIVRFLFDDGAELFFILFGPATNALLFDDGGELVDSFKRTDFTRRDEFPLSIRQFPGQKIVSVKSNQLESSLPILNSVTQDQRTAQERVREWILSENPKLSRTLLRRLLRHESPIWVLFPEIETESGARAFAREMTHLISEHPEPRVLEGGICSLVPSEWLTHEQSERVSTANEMVQKAFYSTPGKYSFETKKSEQIQKLEGLIQKRRESLRQLADERKTLERADRNEKYGHLLLANAHLKIDPDQTQLEVDDLYSLDSTQSKVQIPIDPSKSLAQNAQIYYEKSEKGRRSVGSMKIRRKELEEDLHSLEENLAQLSSLTTHKELDQWIKDVGKEIKSVQPSLPYREIEKSGWKIWVGKNAKSNEIMLSLSHKEDIWMHARGVAGSHVILRMNGKQERPPLDILETAASFAAWFSKARGSSFAPVMFTRRKYVTKPRKSPAGAVLVQKEEVLIVPPVCPPQSPYIADEGS